MAEGGRLLCFAHTPLFGQQTFLFLLWFLVVFFLSFIALEIAMLGKGKGAYDTVLRCAAVSSCPFLLVGYSTTGSVAWVLVPSPTLLFDLHS